MNKTEEKRLIYPLELILTGLYLVKGVNRKCVRGTYQYDARRALLLYTFQKFGNSYLPLNREYKPLGLSSWHYWVKYEDFPYLLIPEEKIKFEHIPKQVGSHFYFFHDGTNPIVGSTKFKLEYQNVLKKVFPEFGDRIYAEDRCE